MQAMDALAAKLTAIGLEVESLSHPGETLAPFTVAHVIEAKPHPNADKLRALRGRYRRGAKSRWCAARPTRGPA